MNKWTYEQDTENSIVILDEHDQKMCEIVADEETSKEELERAKMICKAVNIYLNKKEIANED